MIYRAVAIHKIIVTAFRATEPALAVEVVYRQVGRKKIGQRAQFVGGDRIGGIVGSDEQIAIGHHRVSVRVVFMNSFVAQVGGPGEKSVHAGVIAGGVGQRFTEQQPIDYAHRVDVGVVRLHAAGARGGESVENHRPDAVDVIGAKPGGVTLENRAQRFETELGRIQVGNSGICITPEKVPISAAGGIRVLLRSEEHTSELQ